MNQLFDDFEFRPHYLADLMSNPKGKSNQVKLFEQCELKQKLISDLSKCSEKAVKTAEKLVDKIHICKIKIEELELVQHIPVLSDTCKARLARIYTETTTGRTKDIKSKYIEKGLKQEEECITQYSEFANKMFRKNTKRLRNGYLSGEFDFEDAEEDAVVDTKASWDVFTFDANAFKPINKTYDWQGWGYMWLAKRANFHLVYSLVDTPKNLLEIEKKKLLYDFVGSEEDYQDACKELEMLHTYDDLPLKRKIRIFKTVWDESKVEQVIERLEQCRDYLNNFIKMEDSNNEEENESN